jgi:hypothetical protein
VARAIVSGKRKRSFRSIRSLSRSSAATGSSLGTALTRWFAKSVIEIRPAIRVESEVRSPSPPMKAAG